MLFTYGWMLLGMVFNLCGLTAVASSDNEGGYKNEMNM